MTQLVVRDLEVRYGIVPAVRGLSLTVEAGEVVGLIGPNGAGKSTTLAAVMGLVRPRAGKILCDGRSLVGRSPDAIARAGVSLVPEGRHIFGDLTVEENLRLGLVGRASSTGAAADIARVQELFPIVDRFRHRQAGLLSGGQQQMLAIARALVADPQVLLLDEPSLGLAPSIIDDVFDALAAIRDDGRAILLVEQRAQRTIAFADRSHVLANGELVLELGPDDAADQDRIAAAYFGGAPAR